MHAEIELRSQDQKPQKDHKAREQVQAIAEIALERDGSRAP